MVETYFIRLTEHQSIIKSIISSLNDELYFMIIYYNFISFVLSSYFSLILIWSATQINRDCLQFCRHTVAYTQNISPYSPPLCSNVFAISTEFNAAARCKGVLPIRSCALISALLRIANSATSECQSLKQNKIFK